MIVLNGTVSFLLQDVLPFTVSYEAHVEAGTIVDLFDTWEDAACDIFKHGLEWKYNEALWEAVELDVQQQIAYLES